MVLLQWVVLEPQGPGSIAAVRFSSPVRVRSLRIFPTGAHPFKLKEDIVAVTEPGSLYLDVYFNALPIVTDGRNKPKPSNVLVPTSIAYQGGQVEFTIDPVNSEFATRLMIVRGKFEKLSLAIYGDIVSESLDSLQTYKPRQLPQVLYSSLPPSLDPANSMNPTALAQSLLTLIPEAGRPTLALIVRLMFCLKPSNEDWEEKDFPYLYSILDQGLNDLSLEKAVDMTSRPVDDMVDEGVLKNFARELGDTVEEYNEDQAYSLAKLLSQSASQHPSLARCILGRIDLVRMYIEPNLDRPTLLYLLDASANPDVSRQLNNEQTLGAIVHIRDNPSQGDGARRAASRLYNRIKGWEILEDSLLNTQSSFASASLLVKEITAEENSFGIWLESMMMNNEIVERLSETPLTHSFSHPPVMWRGTQVTSHDEFIAFLRAAVGVAAVVAVYAWADSVPVEKCRERTLAILRLWQNVTGYREIVNHFLLMRQTAYRLECMLPLEDDLPSQAGIDAEHILKALATQPSSMLRPDFVKVMQNLQAPLNYITDNEVMDLKRASALAKDGLSGAVRFLARPPDELDPVQMRIDLRIAVAIIFDVLQRQIDGEKELLETVWDEGFCGLPIYLIRHLTTLSEDLQTHFGLGVPAWKAQSEMSARFQACYDVLELLARFLPSYPPPCRDIITLTKSTANIFVCTDSADVIYAQESAVCITSHFVRQKCTDVLAGLVVPEMLDAEACAVAKAVLKTLLTHASHFDGHDASHHMTQLFWLFDHVLPFTQSINREPDSEQGRMKWIRQVLPAVLSELRSFYSLQELDNKLHLIRRFKAIDEGCIGIAEWLLFEEQQVLQKAAEFARGGSADPLEHHVALWKVSNSAGALAALAQGTADASRWAVDTLLQDENSKLLQSTLTELLETEVFFESVGILIVELSSHVMKTGIRFQIAIMSMLFRAVRCGQFTIFAALLKLLDESDVPLFDENATQEFGEALEQIATSLRDGESLPNDLSQSVFHVLEKITPLDRSSGIFVLRGLTNDSFNELMQWLAQDLPIVQKTKLDAMKLRWTIAGNPRSRPQFIPADYALDISLDNWESLLVPSIPAPSTPKRRSPAHSAEMLGMITVSPPNALLRSPEVRGLTKTYSNNDFRELRQQSAARQNTSRLPSRHVDDFEQGSASIVPLNLNMSSSSPPPLAFPGPPPHRPLPIDPSLPMNPMYYQQ
ncbi:hypothetical protein ACEPAF_6359 [Sanghuangporus sanghuang]